MIVAAHQPSYLPWLGYLTKMACADVFVVMDDLQFAEQNFQNRQRIKTCRGAHWLTVPLYRGSRSDRILDKRINNEAGPRQHWQRRSWLTIENNYRRAPFFAEHADALRANYQRRWHRLIDLTAANLAVARRWFGVRTPLVRASQLGLEGHKTERIIAMCRRLGAHTYLSGRGGSTGYLDVAALEDAGIAVQWLDFEHPAYPQRYPDAGFVSHLGFIDYFFNCGPVDLHSLAPDAAPMEGVAS